jgi:hypothetical protein
VQQIEQEARQERQKDLLPEMFLGPRDMASARREAISHPGRGIAAACKARPFVVQEEAIYSAT